MGSGARLFDIGCGEGANTNHFARQGYAVTGVDISPVAISVAKECTARPRTQAAFRTGDARSLADTEDGSFDIVADVACLHICSSGARIDDATSRLCAAFCGPPVVTFCSPAPAGAMCASATRTRISFE